MEGAFGPHASAVVAWLERVRQARWLWPDAALAAQTGEAVAWLRARWDEQWAAAARSPAEPPYASALQRAFEESGPPPDVARRLGGAPVPVSSRPVRPSTPGPGRLPSDAPRPPIPTTRESTPDPSRKDPDRGST